MAKKKLSTDHLTPEQVKSEQTRVVDNLLGKGKPLKSGDVIKHLKGKKK